MQFNYRARDQAGTLKTGAIEASSKGSALLKLQDMGLYVTSLEEERLSIYKRKLKLPQRISPIDVVIFSRQLATMMDSKITIVESLAIISKQITNLHFQEKIRDISERVEAGVTLSEALGRHPEVFSPFYVSMVGAGEASGKLTESLSYLADHLEENYAFRRKLIGAITYPALILVVFSSVLTFLFLFIIPELVEMLEELDAVIPPLTRAVIGFSSFIQGWWWLIILTALVAITSFIHFIKTKEGRRIFDTYLLDLPIVGTLFKKIYLSYFAENISTLMESGINVVETLDITQRIVGNTIYKDIIERVKKEVEEGKEISSVIIRYPRYFPTLFVQMVIAGEKSGQMEDSLNSAVRFYKEDIDRSLDSYVKLIEPMLIIILGGLVGALVLSILLPIYSVGMEM